MNNFILLHNMTLPDLISVPAVPAPPYLHTKMVNSSVVQAAWEPSTKMGQHEGFKLYYRKAHELQYTGPITFSCNVTHYNISLMGE